MTDDRTVSAVRSVMYLDNVCRIDIDGNCVILRREMFDLSGFRALYA